MARAEIPDTEIGGTGVATTEGARPLASSRGKAPPGGPSSAAVTGVKAQKLRRNLKKGGLPIFYRVAALAFACVGFALIASTGSEACAPIHPRPASQLLRNTDASAAPAPRHRSFQLGGLQFRSRKYRRACPRSAPAAAQVGR